MLNCRQDTWPGYFTHLLIPNMIYSPQLYSLCLNNWENAVDTNLVCVWWFVYLLSFIFNHVCCVALLACHSFGWAAIGLLRLVLWVKSGSHRDEKEGS